MQFQFLQLVVIFLLSAMKSSLTTKAEKNCTQPQSCGSLSIPYPFGTKTSGCYFDETFLITCDQTYNPPKPYLPKTNITVLNISIEGELRIEGPIAHGCRNKLGNLIDNSTITMFMSTSSNFPISSKRNKFTAVGCLTFGIIASVRGNSYSTGCVSVCSENQDVINGPCTGTGCCQMPIPNEIWDYGVEIGSLFNIENKSLIYDNSSCDYAFVVDDSYNFSSLDRKNLQNRKSFPLVLDWSVVNRTCEQAQEFKDNYACQASHSNCVDSSNGIGYRCNCSQGFEGNPYLPEGCKDIDECNTLKPCRMTCDNIPGSYKCSCPFGYRGDGRKDGTGCSPVVAVIFGIGLGFLVLLVGGSWIYIGLKKRKLIKLKEKFFEQNGGLLLQRQLSDYRGRVETAKIFSFEDLKRATDNFDKSKVLGQGGHGTVYKGVLIDCKIVAIKKSKIVDLSQIEEFINEMVLLSQINHRNVVKLLGCCLETEVPLLVYEFISNGTVYDHIHNNSTNISWKMRLKIATETASALAYLHSSTSMPIIHRDVKTTNILLDQSYTSKVSDFGASRLVPLDKTQLTTLVQGTLGYLDPEYFHTSQLTNKSDVYSFGVVLAELLTSEKALSFERPECIRNLATYFVSSMKEESLLSILDNNLVSEGEIEDIMTVANLTKSCLRVRGEDRPTMKEVAMELERLINKNGKHTWREDDPFLEETEYLLKPSKYHVGKDHEVLGNNSSSSISKFDSMENQMLMIHGGR